MNVYTHVSVKDLARDVENLPPIGRATASAPEPAPAEAPADAPVIPDELAALLGRWESLPENIRAAISSLTEA